MTFVPPYRGAQDRPRRRTLDQAQVVRAALELLDEVGLDELTMRRLADRLGIQAASLYRHVRDKNELLVLLADEIAGEIPLPRGEGPWEAQLTEMALNHRRGLLAHRDGARVMASTAPIGPRRLRQIEATLRVLRSAGLSKRDTARAAHHLNDFVTELAADDARFSSAAAALGMSRRRMFAEARKRFEALPAAEYPLLVELAEQLVEDDPEGLFRFGLEIWLDGLRHLARRSR